MQFSSSMVHSLTVAIVPWSGSLQYDAFLMLNGSLLHSVVLANYGSIGTLVVFQSYG